MAFFDFFAEPTELVVTMGAAIIGLTAGALGTFAVLRRQSLIGDAVSHSALPGIAIAFLFFGKQPWLILLGAAIAGWLSIAIIPLITRRSRIPFDSALGGTLAVFFGAGLVVMTLLQHGGSAVDVAEVKRYLFGQAGLLKERDVIAVTVVGGVSLFVMWLFWKEFKLVSFDPQYAAGMGIRVGWLDVILTTLLVMSIVIGLQAVGVVLMSTLLIAPAVAARQWTNRLGILVVLAGVFGILVTVTGTRLSIVLSRENRPVPPGPVIVLCGVAWVLVSLGWRACRYRLRPQTEAAT